MNIQSLVKTLFYKAGYSVKKIRSPASKDKDRPATGKAAASPDDLMRLLHKVNPYDGFDFQSFPFDAHGWGGQSPAFRALINERKPKFIIEVGTWKGASALEMAAAAHDAGLPTRILCIDTWLGALEFWTNHDDPERYGSLQLQHGYPRVFHQFLANVCHRGFQDRIVPFPQTASIGALWLRYYGFTADMIYVDASHEEEDVYEDLCSFWDLVHDDGIVFGDDYAWDGVRMAVDRFAREERRQIEFNADKWLLKKTP